VDVIEEPLAVSAQQAFFEAQKLCPNGNDHPGCRPYHQLWQILRLLGLGATLGGHPEAYLDAFAQESLAWGPESKRVLIAGAADYSMLAHLLHGLARPADSLDITVVDLCPTPLSFNAWYADSRGLLVRLVQENLLDHADGPYDLIVTSSLLGNFAPGQRRAFFSRVADLLSPAGTFITSNRIRSAPEERPLSLDPSAAKTFAREVVTRAEALHVHLSIGREELRQAALDYAEQRRPYPFRGLSTLRPHLQSAALRLLNWRLIRALPAHQVSVCGPTLNDGSEYLFFRLGRL
jgi:SAM-dependent methyltransferase